MHPLLIHSQNAALAAVLKNAARLVPTHTNIAVLETVKIEVGADGLGVTVCDMDAWFVATVDSEPRDESWSGCVAAAGFEAFVSSIGAGGEITLTADDTRLIVSGGGAVARFRVMDAAEFPVMHAAWTAEPVANFEIEPDALSAALSFVEPVVETFGARPHLMGAFVDGEGFLVACDGHRVATYRLPVALPAIGDNTIVPAPILKLLPHLLRGFTSTVTVTIAPRGIRFGAGSWTLTSKLIDATYPTWRSVIPQRVPQPIVVEAKALRSAAARVATVCGNTIKTRAARLGFYRGELSVSAVTEGNDTAEVTSVIAVQGGADGLAIGLSAKYLVDALDVIEGGLVELHIRDPVTPAWLCAASNSETGVAIMAMRV